MGAIVAVVIVVLIVIVLGVLILVFILALALRRRSKKQMLMVNSLDNPEYSGKFKIMHWNEHLRVCLSEILIIQLCLL